MSSKWRPSEMQPLTMTHRQKPLLVALCSLLATLAVLGCNFYLSVQPIYSTSRAPRVPLNAQRILGQCAAIKASPGPPKDFFEREESDRYEPGTNATLIRDATIWTGEQNGTEIIRGDLLLEKGLVKGIGDLPRWILDSLDARNLTVVDAHGAWVTPGLGL